MGLFFPAFNPGYARSSKEKHSGIVGARLICRRKIGGKSNRSEETRFNYTAHWLCIVIGSVWSIETNRTSTAKCCWCIKALNGNLDSIMAVMSNDFFNAGECMGGHLHKYRLSEMATTITTTTTTCNGVMEGQWHNNPLNPRCFCLQRPKTDGTSS